MDTTENLTGGRATRGSAPDVPPRSSWWNRPRTVVVGAVLTGALVFRIGTALGVDPQVRAGSGTLEVTISAVIAASLTAALAGWGVRALLLRRRNGGRAAWLVLSGAVLLVSLLGPLGAATAGAILLLLLEHLAVGAVIALGLSGAAPRAATAA
ncbi:DUF6069 family protein [Krasilnikoviella flava]|uniref:Uncharacterized protein n=1 Tax=Krasilnikoviella flava TaxID=526729 RepID=A0A1T5IUG5_9MICO|nr:DUF6069 family protein [Krasilnikoviella flava]SKC42794.1 hypothetical protein SAMN04324258_0927 [Krasilnikoviella flava]